MEHARYDEVKPVPKSIMIALIAFMITAICVGYLSYHAQQYNRHFLNIHIKKIAEHAALLIDGDAHEQLMAEGVTGSALYNRMVEPLVKLHNIHTDIHYIYTMKDTGSEMIFGLDTSYSPLLKTELLLEASEVGEVWVASEEVYRRWSTNVKNAISQGTHLDEEFSEDEFGVFLTASAPFFNSKGEYVGFVGVDIGANYYEAFQTEIKNAILLSSLLSVFFSLLLVYFTYRNLNSIKQLQEKLFEDSITDPLTKCFNRRYFDNELNSENIKNNAYHLPYCLAVIDIDHFKMINDIHGHDAGDIVLQTIVEILSSEIRKTDELFRIGGEEFAIIFKECHRDAAENMIEKCRLAVENHSFEIGNHVTISATISAGLVETNHASTKETFKMADEALYQAKENGRNQIKTTQCNGQIDI